MNTTLRACAVAVFVTSAAIGAAHAATYSAASVGNYTAKADFTSPCATGPCQNYTTAMAPSGSFTTAAPLAANLSSANIAAQITSFSFSDGINTYASTDPNVRVYQASVTTSATGSITSGSLIVELWQSGASPHVSGDRFAYLSIGAVARAYNNDRCDSVGTSLAGTPDSCNTVLGDASLSTAWGAPWTWASPPTPVAKSVPTVSEWGLIILSAMMGAAGLITARRRRLI